MADGPMGPEGDESLSDESEQFTGRYIVVFADEVSGDSRAMAEALNSVAGVTNVASTRDYEAGAVDGNEAAGAEALTFAELGLAVVAADPSGARSIGIAAADDPRILVVEPERILYAIDESGSTSPSLEYARGFRDATVALYEGLSGRSGPGGEVEAAAASFADTPLLTWGLQATRADACSLNGAGIRVAVLDTGFDLTHPDFVGRNVTAETFITGQAAQDGHGHGTHCIGTACGSVMPAGARRYGVATATEIFVGKVLSNEGSGNDAGILAGINWAVANHCQVISMSLGADIRKVSQAYEKAGQRALAAGSLIVAAAGNNASRSSGNNGFVGVPANSPSIMAVGAVDSRLRIADFSARSKFLSRGGQVDIAGPGVAVYSSWPLPKRYHTISGTSMATPHVSGLAALWHQSTGKSGKALWDALVGSALKLDVPKVDVGAGLAQAP